MNADAPYIAAAEEARIQAQDLAAARPAVAAIHAIAQVDLTPEVIAQLCGVLSARIAASGWSHFPEAVTAMELLDSAHDRLAE